MSFSSFRGPGSVRWAQERLNRLGSLPPSLQPPTASKLGNLVAGTKRVFVGFPSCLGGCSRTTAFLAWIESVHSAFPRRCRENHGLSIGRNEGTARGLQVLRN